MYFITMSIDKSWCNNLKQFFKGLSRFGKKNVLLLSRDYTIACNCIIHLYTDKVLSINSLDRSPKLD